MKTKKEADQIGGQEEEMERIGEITAIHGDMIEVTFCREEDCGKCNACSGRSRQVSVTLPGEGQVGDAALVDMPTGQVMRASALAYALPLAGLLGGAVIGGLLGQGNDTLTAICGLLGLGVMGVLVVTGEKKRREDAAWKPVLKQVIPKIDPVQDGTVEGA